MSGTKTRRDILRGGAIAAVGMAAGSPRRLLAGSQSPLSQFSYSQVRLAPGPLERQVQENHQLLLEMNEDSMLRPFRVREGLPAPGSDLGGWYDTYAFSPCETFGQWVSSLARFYAISGDAPTREKVSRLVRAYAATVEPEGKFYRENRFPAYTYDKIVLGLLDAHEYTGDPIAFDVLNRATDAVGPFLPAKAQPHWEAPVEHREDFLLHCWDESYTLSENQFLAWERTGNPRYRDLGVRLLYNDFYWPLANNENVLPGKHAYSHVNSLSSAAKAYLALGDERLLRAAKNAFSMIEAQSYATGGWGPDEHFFEPGSGHLESSLHSTHSSFETPCGSYAHFKLTRYLLRITRDPHYGDSMERVLYNTVLGAKPLQSDGATFYYSDYNTSAHKFYHPDKWPCCSGTLPQVTADYRVSAYFRDRDSLYINLYLPSTLNWTQGKSEYSIRQTTDYPYDSRIRIDFTASRPETFSVFLRVPEWARGAALTVNGKAGSQKVTPGTFAEVRREWKRGDRIELDLPLTMRLQKVDEQHPETVALLCGPLVLMPLADTRGAEALSPALLLSAGRRSQSAHEWSVTTNSGSFRLRPFPDIQDERYSVYSSFA